MKVAVLADIHSNLSALEAVAEHIEHWRPDVVIVAGDVVNRGPRPADCLHFILYKGWPCVLGNHEEYVIEHSQPGASRNGPRFQIQSTSFWTYQQLNCDVSAIQAWPFQRSLSVDGAEVRCVHASMLGTRQGVFVGTPDEELRQKIAPPPRVFVVGHTHQPLIRQLDKTLVVNAGSVGLPFDGDPRAGYAQLTWHSETGAWQAEIVRLAYDRERADRDFDETGFITQGGPFAVIIRDELRRSTSHLYEWTRRYESAVMSGELTLEESVQRYLVDVGLT